MQERRCLKYENINSSQHNGEKGVQPPQQPGSTPNTCGIQHWWPQRALSDHTQVRCPEFSYSQLKSPKEFVLRIHYEEQLWTYTITFMTEELRNRKREREPQTYRVACSVEGGENVQSMNPITRVYAQGLVITHSRQTPKTITVPMLCLCPPKHAGG